MASKCDYTNEDGTVTQQLIEAARDDPNLGTFDLVELEDAYGSNTAISECQGGRSGICDYTTADGTVTDGLFESAQAAVNGDRLSTFDFVDIQSAYNNNTAVSECAPSGSTVEVSAIDASGSVGSISITATITNTVTSGSGETLTPTITTTVDGRVVNTRTITIPPNRSTSLSDTVSASPGGHEVCVDVQ